MNVRETIQQWGGHIRRFELYGEDDGHVNDEELVRFLESVPKGLVIYAVLSNYNMQPIERTVPRKEDIEPF